MKIYIVISCVLLGCSIRGYTQPKSVPAAEKSETNTVFHIGEEDYLCLQNIHCLEDTGLLKEKGWDIRFENMNDSGPYTLTGHNGSRKTLEASYDEKGELIDARLTLIDVVLPRTIRDHLGNKSPGWVMNSNEMLVEDFDVEKTQYKVNLEKGTQRETLYFDHLGEQTGPRDIVLLEVDYSCLQNIQCLKDTNFLKKKGWNIRFENDGEVGPYTLEGSNGLRKTLNARYDKNGELIEASLIRMNVNLPTVVKKSILTDFPDWTMTSNEMIVTDFDAGKTEYKVSLKKGIDRQTLFFDYDGDRIKGLALK
ncbi:MAG: hypothetical protein WEA56_12780 [Balneolaceae bacterium]